MGMRTGAIFLTVSGLVLAAAAAAAQPADPGGVFTAAQAAAGGLVFAGDVDRSFKAFDVKTGEVLWQSRLGQSPQGFPIAYTANEVQYIAVPTGGNALYVFALAEAR